MRILVTGGLGFVGSNLVDMLVDDGHEVWVLDDLSSQSASLTYRNANAMYFNHDILEIFSISKFRGVQFDQIYHLAARARIQPSFDYPYKYFAVNAHGTATMLEFARLAKAKSFVYATTSSKNHDKGSLLTPYTFSKVVGEDACKLYADTYNMNISMATFYNVYGPREPREGEWATVVAKFGRQWVDGELLTVVGTGEQTRDFTHVEDICRGLIAMASGNWKGDNFDLGRGCPISVLDIAKAYTNMDMSRITFVPLRKNEGMHSKANVEHAKQVLNWEAKHDLLTYIKTKQ